MKSVSKKLLTLCLLFFIFSFAKAQMSTSIFADTISATSANLRRTQLTVINYDVSKLKAIVDACAANGVQQVQFVFALIRGQDTGRYFAKHSIAPKDRGTIVGRTTLLVRVPRNSFGLALNDDPLLNYGVQRMMGGGFIPLDTPYGNLFFGTDYLYFDLAFLCPPPDTCD